MYAGIIFGPLQRAPTENWPPLPEVPIKYVPWSWRNENARLVDRALIHGPAERRYYRYGYLPGGAIYLTESDPANAQCNANDFPREDQANAVGTFIDGSFGESIGVAGNENNAMAASDVSFDYYLPSTTTITWNVDIEVSGPYVYVDLDLGGLAESYCEYGCPSSN